MQTEHPAGPGVQRFPVPQTPKSSHRYSWKMMSSFSSTEVPEQYSVHAVGGVAGVGVPTWDEAPISSEITDRSRSSCMQALVVTAASARVALIMDRMASSLPA